MLCSIHWRRKAGLAFVPNPAQMRAVGVVRHGSDKEGGLRVIPLTLLMVFLLKLIPDGKKAPLAPDLSKDNAWYRATLTELLGLLAAGKIKPVVAERIPLAEAARADELLERGGYAGKVVLVTSA